MPGVINKKVFISYAREDEEKVSTIHKRLNSKGIDTWYDWNLKLGDPWESKIGSEIRTRGYFLVCLSNAACEKIGNESNFIEKEIQIALATLENMGNESYRIIPVKLEECACFDDRIMRFHHGRLDLKSKKGLRQLERELLGHRWFRVSISRLVASLVFSAFVVGLLGVTALSDFVSKEKRGGVWGDSTEIIYEPTPVDSSKKKVQAFDKPKKKVPAVDSVGTKEGQRVAETVAVSDTVYFKRHPMMHMDELAFLDTYGKSLESKWLNENILKARVITRKEDKEINVFFQNKKCESTDFYHRQVIDLNKICG